MFYPCHFIIIICLLAKMFVIVMYFTLMMIAMVDGLSSVNDPCVGVCQYNNKNDNVCIGCFREKYEIQHWSSMSAIEKSWTLEDAQERRRHHNGWFLTQPGNDNSDDDDDDITILAKNAYLPLDSNTTIHEEEEEDDDDNITATKPAFYDNEINNRQQQGTNKVSSFLKKSLVLNKETLPPTPCTRICRYNSNFYEGKVCIGCFRDCHDIRHWSSYDPMEKSLALQDAADRCDDDSSTKIFKDPNELQTIQQELNRQSQLWQSTKPAQKQEQQEWQQINIKTQTIISSLQTNQHDHDNKKKNYHDFIEGHSVITFPSLIPWDDCQHIVKDAQTVFAKHNKTNNNGLLRIPIRTATNRDKTIPLLNDQTEDIIQRILMIVCEVLDHDHEALIQSLFGGSLSSLEELIRSNNSNKNEFKLQWASREPAINVYTKGGEFRPHTDGHKLTILIPLSSNDDYISDGTLFWPQESRGHRIDPPTLSWKPDVDSNGATPILFVGHVLHAGAPIVSGQRIVLVASFSLKPSS